MSMRLAVMAEHIEEPAPPPPPPPPPPDPEPDPEPDPPVVVTLLVSATEMRLRNVVSMALVGDHVAVWGHPDEAVEFDVDMAVAGDVSVRLRYALATESQSQDAIRDVLPGEIQVVLEATQQRWAEGLTGWSDPVTVSLPAGRTSVQIMNPATEPWTQWCDLYAVEVTGPNVVVDTDPEPEPVPVPVPSGTLEDVLAGFFPSPGGRQYITWGQQINAASVPAGTNLVLANGDINGGEWIIRGLRGKADAWITIRAETPLGFKVRDLQVWRGIGIYDCQYVRVDGLDCYGMGGLNPDGSGDFTSAVELVGGHHIAATRNRATNTGGHCVSATWAEGMDAPANVSMLYNTALDTSKRNPFNGSAFNLFHGTSKRTPDGPLAALGVTDYIIGNTAFGCMSEASAAEWGITDGNGFILDVGRDSGYDGACLVAFNVFADNGGRGVHTLQTDGLVALFNTCVGNQLNLTEPASGEYSPHTDHGERCQVRGNIAAATTREPAVWYQDWESGNGGHRVAENVVLAGTANAPNNVSVNPQGLNYLTGRSTKSRNVDDYRPVTGTNLVDYALAETFDKIAAVFPDASGCWRMDRICGALDA